MKERVIGIVVVLCVLLGVIGQCIMPVEAEHVYVEELCVYNSIDYDELDKVIEEIENGPEIEMPFLGVDIYKLAPMCPKDIVEEVEETEPEEVAATEAPVATPEPSEIPQPSVEPVETEKPVESVSEPSTAINSDDIYYIANVMAGECYIFEWNDMINVGMTICNRVDSPQFPNTFYGVVTQSNQMNYASGRYIDQTYYDAATTVYNNWIAYKNGEDVYWNSSYLYWKASGGTTNVFRSVY